jgi:hypothetical protein
MRKSIWLGTLILLMLLSSRAAWADDGFYVVAVGGGAGTKITSLPYIIKDSGFYYLTRNLTGTPEAETGITIDADNVTLDLMGFVVGGGQYYQLNGILINPERKKIEIRNGIVRRWATGIKTGGLSSGNRVINVRVENTYDAIKLNGYGHLVKGCTISDSSHGGIYVVYGIISSNVLYDNDGSGIDLNEGNVIGNTVFMPWGGTGTGISLRMGNIIANTIYCNQGQTGIDTSASNSPVLVDQNTVSGSGTLIKKGTGTKTGTNAGF